MGRCNYWWQLDLWTLFFVPCRGWPACLDLFHQAALLARNTSMFTRASRQVLKYFEGAGYWISVVTISGCSRVGRWTSSSFRLSPSFVADIQLNQFQFVASTISVCPVLHRISGTKHSPLCVCFFFCKCFLCIPRAFHVVMFIRGIISRGLL